MRGRGLDHEIHERTRKARKGFVGFAFFRGLRDPNIPTAVGEAALVLEIEVEIDEMAAELREIQESLEELR